jgi:MazG family protein
VTDRSREARFERLVEIMATLRGPEGCPWDREQDLDSLRPMLIEEVYEVIDAVDSRDFPGLAEELGDLLLHVVFHARLAEEDGRFTIDDVLGGISEKLVRRHPHVFGDDPASTSEEVLRSWEEIKKKEKADAGRNRSGSLLDLVPSKLPALLEAHKISAKVARVGFEWATVDDVFAKLEEEIAELREAIATSPASGVSETYRGGNVEEELGDAFFVLVNIARHLGVDSESALKGSNRKFRERWRRVEDALTKDGSDIEAASSEQMEVEWQKAKAAERGE